MSYRETTHVHALFLRTRASVLKHGDKEAQEHARELQQQADAIDPQQQEQSSEEVA